MKTIHIVIFLIVGRRKSARCAAKWVEAIVHKGLCLSVDSHGITAMK